MIRQPRINDQFISNHGSGRIPRIWTAKEISKSLDRVFAITVTGLEHWFSRGYVAAQIEKSQESAKKADSLLLQ